MTSEKELVELEELVALAIRDIKGGLNYDYMDFCRDVARAIIPLIASHCAEVARNPGFIQARDTEWDEGVNFTKRFIANEIEKIGRA